MSRLRLWLADGRPPPEDSVLVLAADPAARAPALAAFVSALTGSGRRLSVVVAVACGEESRALAPRLPGALVRCPRVPPALPARLTLAALRVRAVLLVAGASPPPALARLHEGARRRGVPAFTLSPGDLGVLAAGGRAAMAPFGETPAPGARDLAGTADQLVAAMGAERGQGRLPDAIAGRAAGAMRSPWRRVVPGLHRIADLAALQRQLGGPRVLMCLGNGPTSADPRLEEMGRDALFRVNHQWMRRGFLARPELIFAGVKRSMRAAGPVPVCVANAAKERALIACRLLEPWHGRATYAVAEEIAAAVVPPLAGPRRPTTGAYMIAVAVALRPQRLIVAGMDMFSHPAGAYPEGGDAAEAGANAYAPSHDFDTDTAFLRECLRNFEGEIVTVSPAFADLARSVAGRRFRLAPAEAATPGPALAPQPR